jgi:rhodanese-related sulfurtransferase
VNENFKASPGTNRSLEFRRILLEALLVAAAGAILAFVANALSPRGLILTRNYFPGATNGVVAAPALSVIAGIKEKGLRWMDAAAARRLFEDPRVQQQLVVFIDARASAPYREGHIPGAYEFDPYYPEPSLPGVLAACLSAERIVVYCNGGECEDSQFAAITLRDAGIPNQKLAVFVGGISAWTTNGWPLETGERNSRVFRQPGS